MYMASEEYTAVKWFTKKFKVYSKNMVVYLLYWAGRALVTIGYIFNERKLVLGLVHVGIYVSIYLGHTKSFEIVGSW